MISAVVKEYVPSGQLCRLEPGTLHLVRAQPEVAVFSSTRDLDEGDEVWIVPMDGSLVEYSLGVSVRGAAQFGQRQGPGMTASAPMEG